MTDAKKPVLTMPDGSKWERVLICELQQNDNYVVTLRTIGGCTETTYYRPLDPTDSQFIVTACNAHDELVDALKAIWAVCESGGKRGRPMDIMSNSEYEWARKKYDKALAQLNPSPEKSQDVCGECGESRPDDERVKNGMKCRFCAYGG